MLRIPTFRALWSRRRMKYEPTGLQVRGEDTLIWHPRVWKGNFIVWKLWNNSCPPSPPPLSYYIDPSPSFASSSSSFLYPSSLSSPNIIITSAQHHTKQDREQRLPLRNSGHLEEQQLPQELGDTLLTEGQQETGVRKLAFWRTASSVFCSHLGTFLPPLTIQVSTGNGPIPQLFFPALGLLVPVSRGAHAPAPSQPQAQWGQQLTRPAQRTWHLAYRICSFLLIHQHNNDKESLKKKTKFT